MWRVVIDGNVHMYESVTNVGALPETVRQGVKEGNLQRSLKRGLHALGYIMSLYQDYYDAQSRGNASTNPFLAYNFWISPSHVIM